MKAVIMAGGEGTRLRPLTCNIPKPMVNIADKPVMEYSIELLKKHRINDIIVTLQYLPNEIKDYFGDGSQFGVNISYYTEDNPLGTAGSVKNAQNELNETFLVISGDAVTDIDLSRAISFHNEKKSVATLVLKKESKPLEYGVVVTDNDGRIVRFIEKPTWSEVFSDTVNTGIYILNPEIFNYYKNDEFFDFSKDLFPMLLNDQKPMYGYVASGYWCDVGDLDAYLRCQFEVLENKVSLSLHSDSMTEGIFIGQNTQIEKGVVIKQPVYIGDNVVIKNGASIGPYAVIGSDCTIMNYASVKKSIILKGAHLGRCTEIRGTIIGNHSNLKDGVSTFEGVVIGDKCNINSQAKVNPMVKIWPNKTVEGATIVSDNLVWGSYHTKAIFSDNCIAGEINVDITPEYASKLGAAFGSLYRGKKIALAIDGKQPSKMLKASFSAGLLSAGVQVIDFETTILPALRYGIGFFGLSGGVYLKSSTTNFCITMLNQNGANLPRSIERKIENNFLRDDFVRCEAQEIQSLQIYNDLDRIFERQIINIQSVRDLDIDIFVESSFDKGKDLISSIFSELGCNISFGNVYSKPDNTIGVIFDDTFDSMVLVDENSKRVDEEKFQMLKYLLLLKNEMTQDLIVPISASKAVDELADKYKVSITRTKTGFGEIMEVMSKKSEKYQILMSTNPIYFLIVLLGTLKKEKILLHELIKEIPSYYKATSFVDCNFDQKGEVIKKLIKNHEQDQTELTEGIKIFMDKGWTLIVPDNEMPIFKIISEGFSEEFAKDLSENCCREIDKLLKNQ